MTDTCLDWSLDTVPSVYIQQIFSLNEAADIQTF